MDGVFRQPLPHAVGEERRGLGFRAIPVAHSGVIAQRRGGGRVQGHLPLFALLGRTDMQRAIVEIDVLAVHQPPARCCRSVSRTA
jgi:hypothetical protein